MQYVFPSREQMAFPRPWLGVNLFLDPFEAVSGFAGCLAFCHLDATLRLPGLPLELSQCLPWSFHTARSPWLPQNGLTLDQIPPVPGLLKSPNTLLKTAMPQHRQTLRGKKKGRKASLEPCHTKHMLSQTGTLKPVAYVFNILTVNGGV